MELGSAELGQVGLASVTELVWEAVRSHSLLPRGMATPGGEDQYLAARETREQVQVAEMQEQLVFRQVKPTS